MVSKRLANCRNHLRGSGGFDDVSGGPRVECFPHERGVCVHRAKHNLRQHPGFFESPGSLETVQHWHRDVQDDYVGTQSLGSRDDLLTIVCGANNVKMWREETTQF